MTRIGTSPGKNANLRGFLGYALGETIIVTIGILIAFSLNNWNEDRIKRKLEKEYYQSMKNQLVEDLNTLKGNIEYNQAFLNQFSFAREIIRSEKRNRADTLGKIALNLVRWSDFRRKSNVYQTLVSTGEIVNITNRHITEELQSLEELYSYIDRLEENHSSFIMTQIVDDLKNNLSTEPFKVENPGNLFSFRFQNNFDFSMLIMKEKADIYHQAENKLDSIIVMIDNELKK
ncbi:MAG: DUF6090 family protein [Bacteroidota bacterium]|nr:DUF6090 family protein [Bacteroidota bacterium]